MNSMFLKLNFDFLDSGAAGAVPAKTFYTFIALWRFVRRTDETSRKVMAVVSAKTIANTLGVCERGVRYDLALLRDLGWVKPLNMPRTGQAQEWSIGYVAKDEDGKLTETLFAEEWFIQLRCLIEAMTGLPVEQVPREERCVFARTKLKVSREVADEHRAVQEALSAADNVIQLPVSAEKI